MIRHVLAASTALILTACTLQFGAEWIVEDDYGGDYDGRKIILSHMVDQGTAVTIRGNCFSACAMFLDLPDTCVEPNSTWIFHDPWEFTGQGVIYRLDYRERYAAHLPAALARWYLDQPVGFEATVSGAFVIDKGAREC